MGVSATWKENCGRWEVTLRLKGKRRRKLAPKGVGKLEAKNVTGQELLQALKAEEKVTSEAVLLPTISAFCSETYKHSHGCDDRTWAMRKYKIAGIMEDLGHMRLDEVTTAVVARWLTKLAKHGAPLTSRPGERGEPLGNRSGWNDYLKTLRAIFGVAIEQGFIDDLPFRQKCQNVVQGKLSQDRIWTATQRSRLVATAHDMDPGIHYLARMLMLTGCRPIELLRMSWSDIFEVPRPAFQIWGKRSPKRRADGGGDKVRSLPLFDELESLLREIPRDGPAVFSVSRGPNRGKHLSSWPQLRWERVAKAAGVPTNRYDLRHTFITDAVAAGVPLALVAEWCGNSVRVIEERYLHLKPGHLDQVALAAAKAVRHGTLAIGRGIHELSSANSTREAASITPITRETSARTSADT